jgi:hypothetical protein
MDTSPKGNYSMPGTAATYNMSNSRIGASKQQKSLNTIGNRASVQVKGNNNVLRGATPTLSGRPLTQSADKILQANNKLKSELLGVIETMDT